MSQFWKCEVTAAVVVTLMAGGCGGDEAVSFKKGGPPAPKQCVDRWNADQAARSLGKHAYSSGHDSRAARVFFVDEPRRDLHKACVVVFAALESDREYGTLGAFSSETRNVNSGLLERPWRLITFFPGQSQDQRFELQRSGAERANVALEESGEIRPFE